MSRPDFNRRQPSRFRPALTDRDPGQPLVQTRSDQQVAVTLFLESRSWMTFQPSLTCLLTTPEIVRCTIKAGSQDRQRQPGSCTSTIVPMLARRSSQFPGVPDDRDNNQGAKHDSSGTDLPSSSDLYCKTIGEQAKSDRPDDDRYP